MSVYERVSDACSTPVMVDEELVAQLLEERHHFRMQRKWEEADSIFRRLVAAGVLIDDKKKTWNLGPRPKLETEEEGHVACEICRKRFRSRNQLFKHLRQPGPCALEDLSPIQVKAAKTKTSLLSSPAVRPAVRAARHAEAEACLWLGDLPNTWAKRRRVGQLLYRYAPAGVEQAWVKKVVKRQYKNAQGKSLGYAIVCYRDAEEANLAREALDGLQIFAKDVLGSQGSQDTSESFVIRARQAAHGDSATVSSVSSVDPSPVEQLQPLPLTELQRRVGADYDDRERLIEAAVKLMISQPRKTRFVQGIALPFELSVRLLRELQNLRWPAKNHRPCLTCDRYLVLHRNIKDSYGPLRNLCAELMSWACPAFYYSGYCCDKELYILTTYR